MANKVRCPIVNREIEQYNCFEVCQVAERMVKDAVIPEEFSSVNNFRDICNQCPNHMD